MNRAGVIFRIGLEALLAFFCSLNVPVSGMKLALRMGTVSPEYAIVSSMGLALQLVLCLMLTRDVVRLVWRLRSGRVALSAD